MEINWVTPPESLRSNSSKPFIEELKKRPYEWALWKTATYASSAYAFRKRYEGIEITLRNAGKNDKGTNVYDIYVMWSPKVDVVE
jgi:hypothetical protein